MQLIEITLLVAGLSACLMICFKKWGWLQHYDVYHEDWQEKLSFLQDDIVVLIIPERCDFCFCFRIAVVLTAVLALLQPSWWLLAVPFISAPISLKLL